MAKRRQEYTEENEDKNIGMQEETAETEALKDTWLIEIVNGMPKSYMDTRYLNPDIKYFDEAVEVEKSEIDIGNIRLYKFENGKLLLSKELQKEEQERLKEEALSSIREELSKLKVEYSEKEFIFKDKYLQKNREVGDRNNLTSIVLMLTASKQSHYDSWKVIDKDTGKDVYLKLSLQELNIMALHMQEQVTKAMRTESKLKEKLNTLSDEELKSFNPREEYERAWNS